MKSEIVFRKPLFYTVCGLAIACCFSFFVVAVISRPQASDFFGALILTAFMYFFYLLGWQSCVRIVEAGVIVDNLWGRNYIPWRDLAHVTGKNGLLIVTGGGQRIGSLMYGGSPLGLLTGNRQSQAVARKIASAQERASVAGYSIDMPGNQEYYYNVDFQVWPLVVPLAATELAAALSYAFH